MKKVDFKCHNCNSDMKSVLNNIVYNEIDDIFFFSIDNSDEFIEIGGDCDIDNMILHCGKCNTSFNLQDVKNYRIKLNRDKNINKVL